MPTPEARPFYSLRQYLEIEETSNVRHEYFEGDMFAMAGGTYAHATLAAAVIGQLAAALAGSPRRASTSDLRVRVSKTGLATYPDVTVVCGTPEFDPERSTTVINPTVVFEVTSDSTRSYDRGDKLAAYKLIPSLRAVVFISHRSPRMDIVERTATNQPWTSSSADSDRPEVAIDAIDAALDVNDLYAGVDLSQESGSAHG